MQRASAPPSRKTSGGPDRSVKTPANASETGISANEPSMSRLITQPKLLPGMVSCKIVNQVVLKKATLKPNVALVSGPMRKNMLCDQGSPRARFQCASKTQTPGKCCFPTMWSSSFFFAYLIPLVSAVSSNLRVWMIFYHALMNIRLRIKSLLTNL